MDQFSVPLILTFTELYINGITHVTDTVSGFFHLEHYNCHVVVRIGSLILPNIE